MKPFYYLELAAVIGETTWFSWWAISIYVALIITLLGILAQFRIATIKNKMEKVYEHRLFKQMKLDEGKQLEKDRVAKELHDGVLGSIFGIRLCLDNWSNSKDDIDKKEIERYLKQLSNLETDIRTISYGLSPNIAVGDLAFTTVINEYLYQNCVIADLEYNFENDPEIAWEVIDDNIKFNLYRVIQEAFQNVVKHANASHIEISFRHKLQGIILTINDNGNGFKNEPMLHTGIGLKSIRSRIKKIGGSVKFRNAVKKGVEINIEIPIFN